MNNSIGLGAVGMAGTTPQPWYAPFNYQFFIRPKIFQFIDGFICGFAWTTGIITALRIFL